MGIVLDEAGRNGTALGLDDLLEKEVDSGGVNVGLISAVTTELGEEGGVVVLLDDGGDASYWISCSKSRAQDIGERSAMVIERDGYVIRDALRDKRPVF